MQDLLKDKDELASKLISVEEDLYTAKVTQLDLIKQLEILQKRLIHEQYKMQEIERKNVALSSPRFEHKFYIGRLDDKTDSALGEYLSEQI